MKSLEEVRLMASNGVQQLEEAVYELIKKNPDGLQESDIGDYLKINFSYNDSGDGHKGYFQGCLVNKLSMEGRIVRINKVGKKLWIINDHK